MSDTTPIPLRPAQEPAHSATHRSAWLPATPRTIVALMLREMSTSYGRSPGGYLWAILEPLGMIIILALGFSLLMRSPSLGTSFILFYATGFLPYEYFQVTTRVSSNAMRYSTALLTYPAVTWFDAVIARWLLKSITSMLVGYLLFTGILVLTDARATISPVPILKAYGMAGMLGLGMGLINGVIIGFFPIWDTIWSIITRPLFLASGVILMYEDMPAAVQNFLWWNPLMHVTGEMRRGFFGMYDAAYVSEVYVMTIIAILCFFGFLLLRRYHLEILNRL
ncbi:ABC transporter permease [Pelagovum pacificum]|uniref:Transport permease protein n=1 Tax=Pelagovum pacificum TaxID=2588711 RepID=A0A5C5G9A5_9RHOB|nr:ABC transporter permease [Pelagovum pacificum]QQA45078.1 ABC transporter permease [Pelagovum pacificum]TNY30548.1 sugar ABC transporter permease [Pelagovum pacificum]